MKTFKEYVNEVKSRRAWNGNLKGIDSLLAWMYDKGILTKGEQSKKDTLFRKYYRYYNDGDFPKGIPGVYKGMGDAHVEEELEKQLEDFIKGILSKYTGRYDKSEFKYDIAMEKLKTVISVTDRFDVHGLVTYWKKDVSDEATLKLIDELETAYIKLNAETKIVNDGHPWEHSFENPQSKSMVYRSEEMNKVGIWTDKMDKQWKDIKANMIEISSMLKNIEISMTKMRSLAVL